MSGKVVDGGLGKLGDSGSIRVMRRSFFDAGGFERFSDLEKVADVSASVRGVNRAVAETLADQALKREVFQQHPRVTYIFSAVYDMFPDDVGVVDCIVKGSAYAPAKV